MAGEEVLLTGRDRRRQGGLRRRPSTSASGRKGRFVAINCAAIPRELVERELFGYARGAHSQAAMAKPGIIEEAEGGTLFLDEIGEMAPELQTKLLRFTQDRMLAPVGGVRARRIETRIVAATSRTAAPSQSGSLGLRADLAARLGAEPIRIPPLRERVEDLGALVALPPGRPRQADRAGGLPGALPLPLARQRARARQGHDARPRRWRATRDRIARRAPARRRSGGAQAQALVAGAAEVAAAARRRGARGAHAPVSRQHDARRARARPQAGAGLSLGQAVRPQRGRFSGQKRGADRGRCDRGFRFSGYETQTA